MPPKDTASSARREKIVYPIPSSTITLDIILNESIAIAASTINATLSGAIIEACKQPQSEIIEGVVNYSVPGIQQEQTAKAKFGITGGIFAPELSWGDIVTVLQGLQRFYEEKGSWVAVMFYTQDEERGPLGDGHLGPRHEEEGESVIEGIQYRKMGSV